MNIKRAFLAAVAVLVVPSLAMAQSTVTFSTLISDTDAGAPDMSLVCNGGLPLNQTAPIGTTFTVTEISVGDVCTVDLAGSLTDGYEVDYFVCTNGGTVTDTGCSFTMGDTADTFQTQVWVAESPADFNVMVDWEISDDADLGVGEGAMLSVYCDSTTVMVPAGPNDEIVNPVVSGVAVGESCTAMVVDAGSAVDVSPESCTQTATLDGGDLNCQFTATAFYEGIPTLSQYGMAIMALLMLGVGFVGFRRFV